MKPSSIDDVSESNHGALVFDTFDELLRGPGGRTIPVRRA